MAVECKAMISQDGKYRVLLQRKWEEGILLPFIMLNPSTVDAVSDDPTIRRCMRFAQREGFAGIVVVNLFSYRATNPKELWTVEDPEGPDNAAVLNGMIGMSAQINCPIVCAWGANKTEGRATAFRNNALMAGARLMCLGRTKKNEPRHPLYVPISAQFMSWP